MDTYTPLQLHYSSWYTSPAGALVYEWEQKNSNQLVSDLFGECAVQIGGWGLRSLKESRMQQRIYFLGLKNNIKNEIMTERYAKCIAGTQAPHRVFGDPHWLPFDSNSVDLIVLPHVLEFAADPYHILREVDRVLKPEGRLLLFGFNPYSLMSLQQKLTLYKHNDAHQEQFPWSGQYISLSKLKEWLQILNFTPERGKFGHYRPLTGSRSILKKLKALETIGDRWWPITGAVYFYLAIKRVHGTTIIGMRSRKRFMNNPYHCPQNFANTENPDFSRPTQTSQ